MIEPDRPVTIRLSHKSFPAFLLASDEGKPLLPTSVILRHRHLRQQQRVLLGIPTPDTAGARRTRGVSVPPLGAHSPRVSKPLLPLVAQSEVPTIVPTTPNLDRCPPPPAGTGNPLTPSASSQSPSSSNGVSEGSEASDTVIAGKSDRPTQSNAAAPQLPYQASPTTMHVVRHERGIRSRNEKTIWFASSGGDLLSIPPPLPLARFGDLYVHDCTDGSKQAWLFSDTSQWLSIDLGHPHPYLKGYMLNFCANGEPSWVTKDTIRTYKGRTKKREKHDKGPSPGLSSVATP
ncbi:hypothetical protein OH77DRAFT_1429136 [Trametes cingulata]|nr:hypothetical protein OH77DRAFT_1429136 [Trametes cingulata]